MISFAFCFGMALLLPSNNHHPHCNGGWNVLVGEMSCFLQHDFVFLFVCLCLVERMALNSHLAVPSWTFLFLGRYLKAHTCSTCKHNKPPTHAHTQMLAATRPVLIENGLGLWRCEFVEVCRRLICAPGLSSNQPLPLQVQAWCCWRCVVGKLLLSRGEESLPLYVSADLLLRLLDLFNWKIHQEFTLV